MEPVTLTIGDLQVLSDLDSKQFGFLILTEEGNAKKKAIVLKAINYLERVIVRTREKARAKANQDENNQRNNTNANTLADVDAKIYCKLGHLHLLLEGSNLYFTKSFKKLLSVSKVANKNVHDLVEKVVKSSHEFTWPTYLISARHSQFWVLSEMF